MKEVLKANPEAEINKIQRKLIKEVVQEITTPMQRNFNVDLKTLRKIIEECMKNIKNHQERHMKVEKEIDEMNTNLVRSLKNSDTEKGVLTREIYRMQHIDRLKVAHAKDSFYNPDIGTVLPSLNNAHASGSVNGFFLTQSQSMGANE
jgi:septal ring factor EnvC (AmiA/AmiB activator)